VSVAPALPRKPRDDEVDIYGLSHTGRVRRENQDHFLIASIHKRVGVVASNLPDVETRLPSREQRLAVLAMVADGVGGGVGGAEASALALETVMKYVDSAIAAYVQAPAEEAGLTQVLQVAALRAHDAVLARRSARDLPGTMATTLTLFLGVWPYYYVVQVGDSRYYLWRDGVLTQVTRDQTMAQDLVDEGVLTSTAAALTPMAHVLSSAIGADTAMPVVARLAADWRNVHLLCSDGLTKHVTDARIAEILATMVDARQACEQLLQEAIDGGGTDNITVIVARTVERAVA
jgi:protein phosphatase